MTKGDPVDLSGLEKEAALAKISEVCNGPNPVVNGPLRNLRLWGEIYDRLIEPLLKMDGDDRERRNRAMCWDQGYRAAKEESEAVSVWLATQRASHSTPFPVLPRNPYRETGT